MSLRRHVPYQRGEGRANSIERHRPDALLFRRESTQVALRHVVVQLRSVSSPHSEIVSVPTDIRASELRPGAPPAPSGMVPQAMSLIARASRQLATLVRRRILIFAQLCEDDLHVRARWRRGWRCPGRVAVVVAHAFSFSFGTRLAEPNSASNTISTSGRVGEGVDVGGGVLASLIATPSACRVQSP